MRASLIVSDAPLTHHESAYRKPFVPPDSSNPLVVRSVSYGGEPHPATAKRTIVVPVAGLPLKNEQAIHKFKVLAGVRWTPEPHTDSGINPEEGRGEHGSFKISCEDFPKGPMNLKWASDTLDRLLAAANVGDPVSCNSLIFGCSFAYVPSGSQGNIRGYPRGHPTHRSEDTEGEEGRSYTRSADTPTNS